MWRKQSGFTSGKTKLEKWCHFCRSGLHVLVAGSRRARVMTTLPLPRSARLALPKIPVWQERGAGDSALSAALSAQRLGRTVTESARARSYYPEADVGVKGLVSSTRPLISRKRSHYQLAGTAALALGLYHFTFGWTGLVVPM